MLPILGLCPASCGSSGPVPPEVNDAAIEVDAPPPDASLPDARVCACPGTELLSREHLVDTWDYIVYGVFGGLRRCELETDRLIAGGCSFQDPGIPDSLFESSWEADRIRWMCTRQSVTVAVDFFIRCVRPLDRSDEIGEECVCPKYETPADRFFYQDQAITVPAAGIATLDVSCPEGSTLIGGGCKGGHDGTSGDALIMSGGIRPDDQQTWSCTWHAPGHKPISSIATAMCLRPPGPDAVTGEAVEPEAFEHVTRQETLPVNAARIIDVECDPGDTLISGGCHVEDPQMAFANLRLKRNNVLPPQDNRPNTWQCAWYNPTTSTPTVVATATCLKGAPVSTAVSQP